MPDYTGGANIAANAAAKAIGGGMPIPAIALSALIGGGSSLLGSIFSGIGKSAERKEDQKTWERQRAMRMADVEKYLKPKNERYAMEKDLGSMDPAFKKMMIGRLTDLMGSERLGKWGINPEDLIGGIGKSNAGEDIPAMRYGKGILDDGQGGGMDGQFGGARIPASLPDQIMKKYGMTGKRGLKEAGA